MVEGWKFLQIWEHTAVPKLKGAGYAVKGDHASRNRSGMLQLLSLKRQAPSGGHGGRFTLHLAVSHDFARRFEDGGPMRGDAVDEQVFHARLGHLMEGRDVWWEYGADEAACAKTVAAISEVAVAYADAWFESLSDVGSAYLLLKKGDLGRENLWSLALYAKALGHAAEAVEWLDRIASPPAHVSALRREWARA